MTAPERLSIFVAPDKRNTLFFRSNNMKRKILSLLLICLIVAFGPLHAQDTLPNFSLRNIGKNRVVISWTNQYDLVKQINIQRSPDSLKGYKTILAVPDPMNPQNGYLDSRAPDGNQFYRLFIVLDKGMFTFTNPRRPALDTTTTPREAIAERVIRDKDNGRVDKLANPDSVVKEQAADMKSGSKPAVFVPSMRIYTYKDGNVRINLPDVANNRYSVKFFENDDSFLFEIEDLRESPLLLDKSNFYHAGWFKFELYENDKLIEKHKFYLAKEF